MELDDFKNSVVPPKAGETDMGALMKHYEAHMVHQKKRASMFMISFIALSVIFISLRREGAGTLNLGLGLLFISYILGAGYLFLRYKSFSPALYRLPAVEFLSRAEYQLRFMTLKDFSMIAPILMLLGIGGGLIFCNRLSRFIGDVDISIVIWIAFYFALMAAGFYFGKKDWEREHGTLHAQLVQFIDSDKEVHA
jgi:hypothetical protein